MPVIYAINGSSGNVGANTSLWNGVHDATGAKNNTFGDASNDEAVVSHGLSGNVGLFRTFMAFNTSGVSADVTNLTLNIKGVGESTGDIIVVEGTQTVGSEDNFTMNDFTGFQSGWVGGGAGATSPAVIQYSSEVTSWSIGSYNSIPLNAFAEAAVKNNSQLKVCIMNYDYDFLDVAPGSGVEAKNGMYFLTAGGASNANTPYISYDLATAAAGDITGKFTIESGNFRIYSGKVRIKT